MDLNFPLCHRVTPVVATHLGRREIEKALCLPGEIHLETWWPDSAEPAMVGVPRTLLALERASDILE